MYRSSTVKEMRRSWEKERLIYLGEITKLLDALLLSTGKPIAEPILESSLTRYDHEMQAEIDDFVPPLDVYS
jgi:hypothetical protein